MSKLILINKECYIRAKLDRTTSLARSGSSSSASSPSSLARSVLPPSSIFPSFLSFQPMEQLSERVNTLISLMDDEDLLSYKVPVVAISVYLLVILVLKLFMNTRSKPYNVKGITAAHNFFLCALSFAMATGAAYEAFIVKRAEVGVEELFCSTDKKTVFSGRLYFWCVVFYLSKVRGRGKKKQIYFLSQTNSFKSSS